MATAMGLKLVLERGFQYETDSCEVIRLIHTLEDTHYNGAIVAEIREWPRKD